MTLLQKYIWPLIIALLPVPITIWLTSVYLEDSGEVRAVTYYKSTQEKLLNLPSEINKDLKIHFKDSDISNISSVEYHILNNSDINTDDVKLYFNISCTDKSPSCGLIGKRISNQKDEGYSKYTFSEIPTKSDNVIGWNINTFNNNNYLQIKFLFLGEKPPSIDISLVKLGFKLQRVKSYSSFKSELEGSSLLIFLYLFILFILSIVFLGFYVEYRNGKKYLKTLKHDLDIVLSTDASVPKCEIWKAIEENYYKSQGKTVRTLLMNYYKKNPHE